ncbi:MAG: alpha/beta hydrolase [Pontixanthobacter sp.]
MSYEMTRVTLPSGIELDVRDKGPRNAETLIFLHGFPESHRTWRHQIAHFSDRYRCVAPDQRGYRSSSKPQDAAMYTPDKLIGDVFAMADALEVENFTVVGHDWGGAIAWGTALRGQFEGRVKRAIIANAPHPLIFARLLFLHEGQRAASQYIRSFRDPTSDAFVREHGLAALLKRELKWDRAPDMGEHERERQLEDWADPETGIAMLNWYRSSPINVPPMDAPFELPTDYTPPALPNLTIPTLVIWAMNDMALPPANLDGLDDLVDDLTIAKVTDCGHFVTWEKPDAVNGAMAEFLKR